MYLIYSFILFTQKNSTVLHFNKIDIDFSVINNIEKEVIVRPMLGSYELRKKRRKKNRMHTKQLVLYKSRASNAHALIVIP
jgi:hypothetical protein